MTRGPTPRCLIQMSTMATVTDMMHIGNKGGDRPKRTEPPMIFNGSYNGIPCKMMYDTGAGTSEVCPQFVKYHSIEQVPSRNPIRLRYGSGETSDTHQETKEANLSVGEVKFKDTFYLHEPNSIKGGGHNTWIELHKQRAHGTTLSTFDQTMESINHMYSSQVEQKCTRWTISLDPRQWIATWYQ